MITFKKSLCASMLLVVSSVSFAAETLRLFPVFPNTIRNTVGQRGVDLPNTDIAINTVQINVFQPCGVLQFGGFTVVGNCGKYKTNARLWTKAPSRVLNINALPIAVLQYPTTQTTAAYATPNGQPFIIGNLIRYAQQSCDPTQVDKTRYIVTKEACTGGLQVWRRTAPLQ
jgi:hypothetical protein